MGAWGPIGTERATWVYGGKSVCQYQLKIPLRIIQYITHVIYNEFPDRPDRRLVVGDANCLTGNCPEHTSHGPNGVNLDLNYYTWDEPGTATQIKPDDYEYTFIWPGQSSRNYWVCGYIDPLPMFDWERNYRLIQLIKKIWPGTASSIRIDTRLAQFIRKKLVEKYDWYTGKAFWQMVIKDAPCAWNHHMHMHLWLSNRVEWGVKPIFNSEP